MRVPFVKDNGVVFGEVLWDILPTGPVPGGAPMNVAFHLNRLSHKTRLISRVGIDDDGKKLVGIIEKNNIPTDLFQLDYEYETGKVLATLAKNHDVTYEIKQSVAWDNIQWDTAFEEIVSKSTFFVFGSLAARSEVSRHTLLMLLELAKYKIMDINLRPPFFGRETLEILLHSTDFLKLNKSELDLITGWFSNYKTEIDRIKVLQDRFNIPDVVVTKGSEGALFLSEGSIYEHKGFKVKVKDTVGSGDAFLAGIISKLIEQSPPEAALAFACALGATIAGHQGPCPMYNIEDIYTKLNKTPINNDMRLI